MREQTNSIADLSMYDWPETSQALDRLWYAIQRKLNSSGINAPRFLERSDNMIATCKDENLLIGQTCGWPYANLLRGHCIPFARISYDIESCPPGEYNCIYIGQSKKDIRFLQDRVSLRKAEKIAVNSNISQSGFHVFGEITKAPSSKSIPKSNQLLTGSHRASIKAVAEGKAQIAAIDTICFEMARRYDPEYVKGVSILGRSISKPSLPLITSNMYAELKPALLEAVAYAIYHLSDEDKYTLMIKGVMPAKDEDYSVYL